MAVKCTQVSEYRGYNARVGKFRINENRLRLSLSICEIIEKLYGKKIERNIDSLISRRTNEKSEKVRRSILNVSLRKDKNL